MMYVVSVIRMNVSMGMWADDENVELSSVEGGGVVRCGIRDVRARLRFRVATWFLSPAPITVALRTGSIFPRSDTTKD